MRVGFCKHLNGALLHPACDLGIAYRSIVPEGPGWILALPCNGETTRQTPGVPLATCEKFEAATQADVDAFVAGFMAATEKVLVRGISACCDAPLQIVESPRTRAAYCTKCGATAYRGCTQAGGR